MAMLLEKFASDLALDVRSEYRVQSESNLESNLAHLKSEQAGLKRVMTTRFGVLEVEQDLIIELTDGLIGFEDSRHYIVVRHDDSSAFRWLQSLDMPALAFPIVQPGEIRPDYAPTIADADARALQLTALTPTLVFAIVTVPPSDPRAMTANLLGPIVINGLTRKGKQVIIQDEGYTTRHKIIEELARGTGASCGRSAVAGSKAGLASQPARPAPLRQAV